MKILNIILLVVFVASALLQYNDPDPYVWMPLYLFGAAVCYLALAGKKIPLIWFAAGLLVYTMYALYLFFEPNGVLSWLMQHQAENIAQSMKATKPWIEATREFFGLLILIFALTTNLIAQTHTSGITKTATT